MAFAYVSRKYTIFTTHCQAQDGRWGMGIAQDGRWGMGIAQDGRWGSLNMVYCACVRASRYMRAKIGDTEKSVGSSKIKTEKLGTVPNVCKILIFLI
jgi:hypothetical protein